MRIVMIRRRIKISDVDNDKENKNNCQLKIMENKNKVILMMSNQLKRMRTIIKMVMLLIRVGATKVVVMVDACEINHEQEVEQLINGVVLLRTSQKLQ